MLTKTNILNSRGRRKLTVLPPIALSYTFGSVEEKTRRCVRDLLLGEYIHLSNMVGHTREEHDKHVDIALCLVVNFGYTFMALGVKE